VDNAQRMCTTHVHMSLGIHFNEASYFVIINVRSFRPDKNKTFPWNITSEC